MCFFRVSCTNFPTSSMTMVPQSREMILGPLHICGLAPSMITKGSEEVKHTAVDLPPTC